MAALWVCCKNSAEATTKTAEGKPKQPSAVFYLQLNSHHWAGSRYSLSTAAT